MENQKVNIKCCNCQEVIECGRDVQTLNEIVHVYCDKCKTDVEFFVESVSNSKRQLLTD